MQAIEVMDDEQRVFFLSCTDVDVLKQFCHDLVRRADSGKVFFNPECRFWVRDGKSSFTKAKVAGTFDYLPDPSLRLKFSLLFKCKSLLDVISQNLWMADDEIPKLRVAAPDIYPTASQIQQLMKSERDPGNERELLEQQHLATESEICDPGMTGGLMSPPKEVSATIRTTNYEYLREAAYSAQVRSRRNFVKEHVEEFPADHSRSKTAQTKSRIPLHLYSNQKLALRGLRREFEEEQARSVPKGGSEPTVHLTKYKEPFSVVKARDAMEFGKHPKKPSEARAEELAMPWIDPVDIVKHANRQERSSFSTLTNAHPKLLDPLVGTLKQPDMKDLLEDREREVMTWQSKVVVDSSRMKFSGKTNDRFRDILADEPAKLALRKTTRIVPPVSVLSMEEPYFDPVYHEVAYTLKTEKLKKSDLVVAVGAPERAVGTFKRHVHVDDPKKHHTRHIPPLQPMEKSGPLYGK
jgi:hypothetical protein